MCAAERRIPFSTGSFPITQSITALPRLFKYTLSPHLYFSPRTNGLKPSFSAFSTKYSVARARSLQCAESPCSRRKNIGLFRLVVAYYLRRVLLCVKELLFKRINFFVFFAHILFNSFLYNLSYIETALWTFSTYFLSRSRVCSREFCRRVKYRGREATRLPDRALRDMPQLRFFVAAELL